MRFIVLLRVSFEALASWFALPLIASKLIMWHLSRLFKLQTAAITFVY